MKIYTKLPILISPWLIQALMQAIFLKLTRLQVVRLQRPLPQAGRGRRPLPRAGRGRRHVLRGRHQVHRQQRPLPQAGRGRRPLPQAGRGQARTMTRARAGGRRGIPRLQRPLPMQGAGRPLLQAGRGRHRQVLPPLPQAGRGSMPLPPAGRGRHRQAPQVLYINFLALPPRATSVVPRVTGLRTPKKMNTKTQRQRRRKR
jgi:hypothetical protein